MSKQPIQTAKKKKTPKKAAAEKRSQRQRFEEFARAHGADDPDALDRALGQIGKAKKKPPKGS